MKYKGLKRIVSESKNMNFNRLCLQVCYDSYSNSLFSSLHTINSYTAFDDKNIITIAFLDAQVSMKKLEQMTDRRLATLI